MSIAGRFSCEYGAAQRAFASFACSASLFLVSSQVAL
jgi:hypothetical protein